MNSVKNEKFLKSNVVKLVTDDGTINFFINEHPEIGNCPSDFTEDGIINSFSFLQPKNAKSPIDVTEDGIVICFKLSHL